MKFAKMPEEPELPPPPMIEPPEPEPESAATPPSSSPASDDNEADRAEQLSQLQQQVLSGFLSLQCIKDIRAHCYCASLVRTLFIGHVRATSFSSARTESKTQQNIELMTFALTWCANIFVGSSVTPTFFSADHVLF